jgi:integrase
MREAERVLAALMPTNRLVMKVCLHTGLRLGDVLALKTEQLQPSFWVRESKTGKNKQVGLPGPLLRSLRQQAGREWVFEGRSDPKNHRTRQAVYRDVKRAARAFRLPQNVAPHSFRKLYAVELMGKYGDIERVRKALNHGSYAVTVIYAAADKLLTDRKGVKR